MTFKEYLEGRKAAADPAGNFVRLARRDPNFPDARSLSEVLAYLGVEEGSAAASGAEAVWNKYRVSRTDIEGEQVRRAKRT